MYWGGKLLKRTRFVMLEDMDLKTKTDVYVMREEHVREEERENSVRDRVERALRWIF
jgi:hypothetical protein